MNWLIFLLAGLLSGVLAGMGMGGGTILIPALTLFAGVGQHAAQGINMLAYIPGAILAIIVHRRAGRLHLNRCIPLLIGGAAGAVCGAFIAVWLEAEWLRRLFGIFLVLLAVYQFLSGEKKHKAKKQEESSGKEKSRE